MSSDSRCWGQFGNGAGQLLADGSRLGQLLVDSWQLLAPSGRWGALGGGSPLLCNIPPSSGGGGSLPFFQPPTPSEALGRSPCPPIQHHRLRLSTLLSSHPASPVAACAPLSHQLRRGGGKLLVGLYQVQLACQKVIPVSLPAPSLPVGTQPSQCCCHLGKVRPS